MGFLHSTVFHLEALERLEKQENAFFQRDQRDKIQRVKMSRNEYILEEKKNICVCGVQKTCLKKDLKYLEASERLDTILFGIPMLPTFTKSISFFQIGPRLSPLGQKAPDGLRGHGA